MALSKNELTRLAEAGARVRLQELQAEIDAIRRTFPGVRAGKSSVARLALTGPRKLRGWTSAQKKEVSERMKRYWAAKRTGKKKR